MRLKVVCDQKVTTRLHVRPRPPAEPGRGGLRPIPRRRGPRHAFGEPALERRHDPGRHRVARHAAVAHGFHQRGGVAGPLDAPPIPVETGVLRYPRQPAREIAPPPRPLPRHAARRDARSISREQIAPLPIVSHYRMRRAGTRDRSAVVSRSAGEPFLVGNHRWVVCGSSGLGAPARHSEGEPARGARRGRPRPRSGHAGASAVAAPRWRRPCQACRPEVSRNEILIFLEIERIALRPRGVPLFGLRFMLGRLGVLLCAPSDAGFARDLLRR